MNTIRRIISGLILGGALLLPAAHAATGYGDSPGLAVNLLGSTNGLSVSGTVLNASTGLGLVGALVQLGTNATVSGSQGAYSFASVAMGDYTLTGSKPGFNDASYSVTVSAGSSLSRLITLSPTNAAGSLPSVTSVKSKYPDASYYLDDALFLVSFTANVDWAGHPPGTVQFITPRHTYPVAASGASASQLLNMGSEFGVGGHLRVVAMSSDGTKSSAKVPGFTVMPALFPSLLTPVWGVDAESSTFTYNSTLDISMFQEGAGMGEIPSSIPVFGGKPLTLSFLPEADFEIGSDGAAQVGIHLFDLNASRALGHEPPDPKKLGKLLKALVNGGFSTSMLPKTSFGGIGFDFYPLLGGGWQFNAATFQWEWADAFVGLGGEFSIEQTWPFMAGPVPMFAKAKFDVSAEVTAKLMADFSKNGELLVQPSLRGSLGVGLSGVLSAEGWIEGGVKLDLQWPQLPTKKEISFYAKAGATVYAFLWHWDYSGFYWSWPNGSPSLAQALILKQNGEPQPLSRDYLKHPAAGSLVTPGGIHPYRFGTNGGGENPEMLLTPAMPYSDPNCASSGTNLYLVYLEDNTNRTAMNRTRAMYSKFNGSFWTLPIAVADDGTADFHPRILTFADGSAVAAWENERAVLPDTIPYEGMKSNLEVSVAWYNPVGGWQTPRRMTTNDFIDYSPKLAGRNPSNVLLTWVANPANDAAGSTLAPNQLWSAVWNGSAWSAPQLAATIPNALVKYDVAYDGTNGNVVLSVDLVDNSTNANGHELFRLAYGNGSWGTLTRLTADEVPDDNPQLAFDPQGNLMLTWLKGAALSSALNLNVANRQIVRTNEYSSNLADFKLANNATGQLVLLWPEPSENDSDLWALFYDPIFQKWGSTRQLTHDPQTEHSAAAAFYGPNELVAVYNRGMISSTNALGITPMDLMALYYTLGRDLALDGSQFNANPANPAPGSTATLTIPVLNLGDNVETNVVVAFYLGVAQPASEIGRVTLTNSILAQGSATANFNWQVPVINSPVTVLAVVDPDQLLPDVSRTNNLAQINLVKPNTVVQSVTWSQAGSNLLAITIHVANDGTISNGPATISLNRDSATGTNLFSQGVGSLAPGQSTEVTFLWNTTGLPDNLNVYAVLSGAGIANNFSTAGLVGSLLINQVSAPWLGGGQYLTNGGFQVEFNGSVGRDYTLLGSTNLVNWTPVLNFTCTNAPMNVVDPGAGSLEQRFYRAKGQ